MNSTEFKIIDFDTLEIILYNNNNCYNLFWYNGGYISKFISLRNDIINVIYNHNINKSDWNNDICRNCYETNIFLYTINKMYLGSIIVGIDKSFTNFYIIFDLYTLDLYIRLSDDESNEFINKYIEICNILENNNELEE